MASRSRAELAAEGAKLVFGHAQFRPLQEEVITTAMQNKDAFVLLPTGELARPLPRLVPLLRLTSHRLPSRVRRRQVPVLPAACHPRPGRDHRRLAPARAHPGPGTLRSSARIARCAEALAAGPSERAPAPKLRRVDAPYSFSNRCSH